jgi:hypothetical protein
MQLGCVFTHSSAETAELRHSQPHVDVVPDRSSHGDFYVQLKLWDECLIFDKKGSISNPVPQANGI